MGEWELVKPRTAAHGAVWRSPDGAFYKRTGDRAVAEEAAFQRVLADLGYPVPCPTASGAADGQCYFTEPSLGPASLHDQALADAREHGRVSDAVIDAAADISARLLRSQAAHPLPTTRQRLADFFTQAAFTSEVFAENPDLDTPRTRALIETALDRLGALPMCRSHLDYGLPNAFPAGIIDWQHHAAAPLGYDVYPMLDIAAFKGGGKGYAFTPRQRARYLAALDEAPLPGHGGPLSRHLGDFLLVKCFFFLALMRPTPAQRHTRPDKHRKWLYRRELLRQGLQQYASTHSIDTGTFPALAHFTQPPADPRAPDP